MKKTILFFAMLVLALALSACVQNDVETSSPKEEVTEEVTEEITEEYVVQEDEVTEENLEVLPDPVMINADFEVETNPDGSFIIKTNLPDKTELMLKLSGRGYLAQGKAFVSDGMAQSERFTNRGEQLIGNYTLEVMMPIPNVQCDYVKHFIGANGEYLTGPNLEGALGTVVVRKEFDVSFFGNNETKEMDDTSVQAETSANEGKYYRTKSGERYHLDPQCGGKNSYQTNDIDDLTPCQKCVN